MHVKNWEARRSGPAISIKGQGMSGETIKLTGVSRIFVEDGKVVAQVDTRLVILELD